MSIQFVRSVTEVTRMDVKEHYPLVEGIALSTATEDMRDGSQGHENDTDPYSLSHLDPPNDSVYMICGMMVIAMVLVGIFIVLLAVTISKLRKRDDHHSGSDAVHPEAAVVQMPTSHVATIDETSPRRNDCCTSIPPKITVSTTSLVNNICDEHVYASTTALTTTTTTATTATTATTTTTTTTTTTPSANPVEPFAWQFPPPYPPPHTVQYAYNEQNTLPDRPGFAKGFRKNLGGRWRRFVKGKTESDTCAIPPELRDQLKTIYVY